MIDLQCSNSLFNVLISSVDTFISSADISERDVSSIGDEAEK